MPKTQNTKISVKSRWDANNKDKANNQGVKDHDEHQFSW